MSPAPTFVQLALPPPVFAAAGRLAGSGVVEIELAGGHRLRAEAGAELSLLQGVIAVLLHRVIPVPRGSRVWLATGHTDMRKGFDGLVALVQDHLARDPYPCTCLACGGGLRRIGEDVTQSLDYVPGHFKVVRHVREAVACRACEQVVQASAPRHAVPRGRAGPGLLAHIAVAKFDDYLPLYRQTKIYARDGVDLATSTLLGWLVSTPIEVWLSRVRGAAGRRVTEPHGS